MKGVIYRDISEDDLLTFMDKANVGYSIPKSAYYAIFDDNYKAMNIIRSMNKSFLNEVYDDSFPHVQKALADSITPSLIYDNGWRLAITTDDIMNAIFKNFGCIYRTKDYSAEYSGDADKNTKRAIQELANVKNRMFTGSVRELYDSLSYDILNAFDDKGPDYCNLRDEICGFIDTTKYLLMDKEFNDIKETDIDIYLKDLYKPKNLLYALAVSSLVKLKKYKDNEYSLLPNTYYERVSKVGSSPFANSVYINGKKYFTFSAFNELYDEILLNNIELLEPERDLYSENILFNNLVLIPDGPGYDKKGPVQSKGSRRIKMEEEDLESLRDKQKFFESTGYVHKLYGVDQLNGYVGFVYKNNYIVFERFYRDKEGLKPAIDEAIYVMPADKLLLSVSNKQEIMDYIKSHEDSHVKRIIHRGRYKDKVMEVIDSPDVSEVSFDSICDTMINSGRAYVKR